MLEFMKRNRKVKFSVVAAEWLQDSRSRVKQSTLANYQVLLHKHLIPVFGDVYIRNITESQIISYFNVLQEQDLSVSTRRSIQIILHMIFRYAETTGYCKHMNFPPLPSEYRSTINTLTKEEYERLETYLIANLDSCSMGILLCMYTGIRIGEVCGLRWEDIDLNQGIITVRRTLQRVADIDGSHIIIDTPKSRNSFRQIPLPTKLQKLMIPFKGAPEYYLLTGNCHYMEPRSLQRNFKRRLNTAGIRPVKFHILRHTFATQCTALTMDPKSLSYILGHANVNTTMNVYVHPDTERIRCLLDRLPNTLMA